MAEKSPPPVLNLRAGPSSNLQVNFCKNPSCQSVGVPDPLQPAPKGRPKAGQRKLASRYKLGIQMIMRGR